MRQEMRYFQEDDVYKFLMVRKQSRERIAWLMRDGGIEDPVDAELFHTGLLDGRRFFQKYLSDMECVEGLIEFIEKILDLSGYGLWCLGDVYLEDEKIVLTMVFRESKVENHEFKYEEGFILSLVSEFTGYPFDIKEANVREGDHSSYVFRIKCLPERVVLAEPG